MIKVIGIDPGLASTGMGTVSGNGLQIADYSFGSISTSKQIPLAKRLDQIFSKLMDVLQTERPDLMMVEDVFSLECYPKSGIVLGKVSGVILLAASRFNVPVIEVPVREVKQVLTGNGRADKQQLEIAVRHLLKMINPIKPNHASDAMALALIGLFRYEHLMLTR